MLEGWDWGRVCWEWGGGWRWVEGLEMRGVLWVGGDEGCALGGW